jgi:hypothetical protein
MASKPNPIRRGLSKVERWRGSAHPIGKARRLQKAHLQNLQVKRNPVKRARIADEIFSKTNRFHLILFISISAGDISYDTTFKNCHCDWRRFWHWQSHSHGAVA